MNRRAVLHPLAQGVTCIDDAGSSVCYVVCGSEKAAVIDTVNGRENLRDLVREITDLPLMVLNTHGHCDHIFGNTYFEEAYIHPDDLQLHDDNFAMKKTFSPEEFAETGMNEAEIAAFVAAKPCKLRTVTEGTVIDLGGRTLTVRKIAGHTQGSIGLLDSQTGFLFSGDAINGQIWLQMKESTSLATYAASLDALAPYRDRITELHTGHNVEGVPPTYIDEMRRNIQQILDSRGEGDEDYEWFGGMAKRHRMGENKWVLYTPEKL